MRPCYSLIDTFLAIYFVWFRYLVALKITRNLLDAVNYVI